jgi:dTDP-4-amino-4,6-dideoxygalactose transaminase
MAIPLLDLTRQYAYLKPEMDKAILDVFSHSKFVLGPEVTRLEDEIAAYCGVSHAVGVGSGTDALLVALKALGVGNGDEVITTDFSFFATAGTIERLGARPVFVDIEPSSYNIDPNLIEAAVTDRTKVIIPVHLFGQMADMDPIIEIAHRHNLVVVEDAAQAIGAEYKGRKAGSIGDYGCFSFFPSKNLGGSGDGGMLVMNSRERYEQCRMLREHGQKPKYYHHVVGYNSRLDTLQAATLLVKLPHLQGWSEKRNEHARAYDEAFAGIADLKTPEVMNFTSFHIYNQYTLASPKRDSILDKLKEAGVGHAIYYPVPFHKQLCFSSLPQQPGDFPVSSRCADQVFSIPIYSDLTEKERDEVIAVVRNAVA